MLGWSIPLFRIRGIQLSLHWSFLALLAFVGWASWHDAAAQAATVIRCWEAVGWNVGAVLVFFTCVVLHELGHSFVAMAFGLGVQRILLMPIGGMAVFDEFPRQPARELLITLAGPAVNFIIAGVLWLAVGLPPGWTPLFDGYPDNFTGFAQMLLHWNLLMGCFNFIPVFPMDGGRIFRALLATRLTYVRATFWAASVGKVLAVLGAGIAAYFFHAWLTVVLFAFIFSVGELEYRSVKRREEEAEHWRIWWARQDVVTGSQG